MVLRASCSLLAALLVGCFAPSLDGAYQCGERQACPAGLTCNPVDNHCYGPGGGPGPRRDAAVGPDRDRDGSEGQPDRGGPLADRNGTVPDSDPGADLPVADAPLDVPVADGPGDPVDLPVDIKDMPLVVVDATVDSGPRDASIGRDVPMAPDVPVVCVASTCSGDCGCDSACCEIECSGACEVTCSAGSRCDVLCKPGVQCTVHYQGDSHGTTRCSGTSNCMITPDCPQGLMFCSLVSYACRQSC